MTTPPAPTALDFLKAQLQAYKQTLDNSPSAQRQGHVSIQVAEQVNAMVAEIRTAAPPDTAARLPEPIRIDKWNMGSPVRRRSLFSNCR